MKTVRYWLETAFLYAVSFIFSLLPARTASNLGGFIGRSLGPLLPSNKRAAAHIRQVFPNKSDEDVLILTQGMWDNLGRVIAEYPHLEHIAQHQVSVTGYEHIEALVENNKPIVFFGGHIGNWEVPPSFLFKKTGYPMYLMYRPPNNPYTDRLLTKYRTLNAQMQALPKSRAGGQQAIKAVKDGGGIGILIDQKYNEGINSPFFDRDAMTNPFFAQLAQKYGAALVPIHILRRDGMDFELTIHKPLATQDRELEDIVADGQRYIETFIQKTPEAWIWMHRRWKNTN